MSPCTSTRDIRPFYSELDACGWGGDISKYIYGFRSAIFQLFGFTFLASLTQVYRKPFGPRSRLDSPIEVWPKRRQNFRYSCNGKKRGLPTVCRITPRLP